MIVNLCRSIVLPYVMICIYFQNLTMADSKRMSKWRDDWLREIDVSGDKMGEYLVKASDNGCKCLWCKTVIAVSNSGKSALH